MDNFPIGIIKCTKKKKKKIKIKPRTDEPDDERSPDGKFPDRIIKCLLKKEEKQR